MSDHLDTGDVAAGFPDPHEYTVWEDIQGYLLGLVLAACSRPPPFTWSTRT